MAALRRSAPLDVAVRDGVRRGRDLHAAAVRRVFRRLASTLWRAAMRSRSRRDLRGLDARFLRDVGVDADAARRESQKPFWRV
ncbi:MAG: hypothetical protein JJ899_08025 [Alphaproteobacteria bacterium]|nr:hypothetical protein [Alphaproteobacteria bacterium]